jgi:hypothetical protein
MDILSVDIKNENIKMICDAIIAAQKIILSFIAHN